MRKAWPFDLHQCIDPQEADAPELKKFLLPEFDGKRIEKGPNP
jgi:hypothetical protein